MALSDNHKNKLIYTLIGICLAAGVSLFWTLDGPERGGDEDSIVATTPSAPLAEADVPSAEVSLPEITIDQEPIVAVEPEAPVTAAPETGGELAAETAKRTVNLAVPFTSQAPRFHWEDQRQQDGCEEASVLMAMAWIKGEKGVTAAEWEKRIIALADWELEKYGEHRDISVQDTVDWMFKDYFSYDDVEIAKIKDAGQIISALEAGNIVLAPVNGRALKNPNFTAPGPEHHFIVIKGYDYGKKEFIANDPGTRLGADYRYPEKVIYDALRSYPTGYHDHYDDLRKEVIVVEK